MSERNVQFSLTQINIIKKYNNGYVFEKEIGYKSHYDQNDKTNIILIRVIVASKRQIDFF